jgi:flagellar basal body-associated protein FliL
MAHADQSSPKRRGGRKLSLLCGLIAIALVTALSLSGRSVASEPKKEAEPKSALDPHFMKLKPLHVPILKGRRVTRYADLVVVLELVDSASQDDVTEKMTALRDAFIEDLQIQAAMRGSDDPSINLRRVKGRFKILAKRVLGEGVIEDVLIDSALDRFN